LQICWIQRLEDDEIEAALNLMEKRQIRRLPVLSREKRLVGIVLLGDLAVHTGPKARLGEPLEEVSQPATPKTIKNCSHCKPTFCVIRNNKDDGRFQRPRLNKFRRQA
jgi:CBS-domain-containing membrane protein